MKRLIIHIGTGKTGTTSIQDFLYNNKSLLLNHGVNYCSAGMTGNNHHLLCRNYSRGDDVVYNSITQSLLDLKSEIQKSQHNIHVISSEYFPGLLDNEVLELKQLLENVCSVDIILYLRRQDYFLESWYSQVVKAFPRKFDIDLLRANIEKDGIFDYESLVKRWDIFDGKLLVNSYEKSSFKGGDLICDFLDKISSSIPYQIFKKNETYSNLSLSIEQAQLKNELCERANEEQLSVLSKPIPLMFKTERHYLDRSSRLELVNSYKSKNDWVAINYLERGNLFLDTEFSNSSFDGDFLNSEFTHAFILYLKYENPEAYEALSPLLCFYFRSQYDKAVLNHDNSARLKSLFLASYFRPAGPDVKRKYNLLRESLS